MSLGTKAYFTNETTHIDRGMKLWDDVGYSLDIPWNTVYTAGWQDAKPTHSDGPVWGSENKLITRPDPEYYAADGIVRSNIIPEININDPIYSFDRSKHTYSLS